MVEVYFNLDSENEEENYEEVYITSRVMVTLYTINRKDTKEK
ncbi:15273_t:CDS:1, partial [Funneliformis mosseae]